VGSLAQAVEKLTPTRVGVQIEVSELYSRARSLVRTSVTRRCLQACGCGQEESDADQQVATSRNLEGHVRAPAAKFTLRVGLSWFPVSHVAEPQLPGRRPWPEISNATGFEVFRQGSRIAEDRINLLSSPLVAASLTRGRYSCLT